MGLLDDLTKTVMPTLGLEMGLEIRQRQIEGSVKIIAKELRRKCSKRTRPMSLLLCQRSNTKSLF